MDVVVTPASGARNTWSLTDRLGRTVGNIAQSDEGKFVIAFAVPVPSGPVPAIDTVQPTLDAAMDAIALRLKGACQLSSTEGQS